MIVCRCKVIDDNPRFVLLDDQSTLRGRYGGSDNEQRKSRNLHGEQVPLGDFFCGRIVRINAQLVMTGDMFWRACQSHIYVETGGSYVR